MSAATAGGPRWSLTLYVRGAGARSSAALETVRRICDEELANRVDLRVVDIAEEPGMAMTDHILAIPTLIKHLPLPVRRLVGDLADRDRVRSGLDLGPETDR